MTTERECPVVHIGRIVKRSGKADLEQAQKRSDERVKEAFLDVRRHEAHQMLHYLNDSERTSITSFINDEKRLMFRVILLDETPILGTMVSGTSIDTGDDWKLELETLNRRCAGCANRILGRRRV